jgi:hypothetical protein
LIVTGKKKLSNGAQRVLTLMTDGKWRTLNEISRSTKDPEASVSARLRDLRKSDYGAHQVEKRTNGRRARGLYEYRLVVNKSPPRALKASLLRAARKSSPRL